MIHRAVVTLLAAFAGCGATCGVPPPTSETCGDVPNDPRVTITQIEIGHAESGTFEVIRPGETVRLVVGGQGSDMVVGALRITGTGLSGCIPQSTDLVSATSDEVSSSEGAPLRATHVAATTWITGDILLPWYYSPGPARLRSTVYGTTTTVDFFVDYGSAPPVDASEPDAPDPDAPDPDAGADAPPDA